MVDAHSGEVLAFQDKNAYARKSDHRRRLPAHGTRTSARNPDQCGIMQLNWPMPLPDTGLAATLHEQRGVYRYTSGTRRPR
jgi:hypothetical protein